MKDYIIYFFVMNVDFYLDDMDIDKCDKLKLNGIDIFFCFF